jgi:hypothetical protein
VKRRSFLMELNEERTAQLGPLAGDVEAAIREIVAADVPAKLQSRDPALWSGDDEQQSTPSV